MKFPFAFWSPDGGGGGGGGPTFDPATLSLEGWWRGPYAGSPWTGTASAGGSGSRSLTEATHPPSVGTPLNGYDTASLDYTKFMGGAALSNFINASAFSGWALVKLATVLTDSGTLFNNSSIFFSTGTQVFGLCLRNSGFAAIAINDVGGVKTAQTTIPVGTGSYVLIQFRHTGTAIQIRANGGSWVSTAAGACTNTAPALYFCDSITGLVEESALTNITLSDADFDNVLSYVNDRYNLSL